MKYELFAAVVLSCVASIATGQTTRTAQSDGPSAALPAKFSLSMCQSIMDPTRSQIASMSFTPRRYELISEKPAMIWHEPAYNGIPKYGAFRIGDGPHSVTYFALDEGFGKVGKIYVDTNQNGDLTDDGPGDWQSVTNSSGDPNYTTFVTVRASWGTALIESETETVKIIVAKTPGKDLGGFACISARVGRVTFRDKDYPVVLSESTQDGLFTVSARNDLTRNGVTLYIDTESDQPFADVVGDVAIEKRRHPVAINIVEPFLFDGHWYLARPSISGSTLTVVETPAPTVAPATQPTSEVMETIPVGVAAPDFTVFSPDGKPISMSDFKGKVVILDFWATWCAPCQASMPSLEKLYQRVRAQDVVVLSVNVLDKRAAFDAWIKKNAGTNYHFTFGFDAAGDGDASVATSKYKVFSIPRVFVVGRNGNIVASLVGSPDDHDLVKALEAEGVRPTSE